MIEVSDHSGIGPFYCSFYTDSMVRLLNLLYTRINSCLSSFHQTTIGLYLTGASLQKVANNSHLNFHSASKMKSEVSEQ